MGLLDVGGELRGDLEPPGRATSRGCREVESSSVPRDTVGPGSCTGRLTRSRTGLDRFAGEYSHEYFPQASPDGRWLVWGASAGGHEHDRADYEIFIWQIGKPWESARRITYHSANDQWPDLWMPR